jgi:hypothetical protein
MTELSPQLETLLDEAVAALNEGLEAVPSAGAKFVLAFAPLLGLTSPPPREGSAAGRPRGADVEPLARLALERLIAEGKFDMRGRSASSPVLVAMKQILAAHKRQPRLFTVSPELEAARQALAGVEAVPLGGGEAQDPGDGEE